MTFQKTVRLPYEGVWRILFALLVCSLVFFGGWETVYILPPCAASFFVMLHFIHNAEKAAQARTGLDTKFMWNIMDLADFARIMTCWSSLFLFAALWTWSMGASEHLLSFTVYAICVGIYGVMLWRLSKVTRPIPPPTARSAYLVYPFW